MIKFPSCIIALRDFILIIVILAVIVFVKYALSGDLEWFTTVYSHRSAVLVGKGNLAKNPGFEDTDLSMYNRYSHPFIGEGVGRNRSKGFRSLSSGKSSIGCGQEFEINYPENYYATLSVWARTSILGSKGYLWIQCRNPSIEKLDGKTVYGSLAIDKMDVICSDEWEKRSITIDIPNNTTIISFGVRAIGPDSEVCFDDFEFIVERCNLR